MTLDISNTSKVEKMAPSSKLRTHKQLKGKVQLFLKSGLEAIQWPQPTMFGEKGKKYGLLQTTCTKYCFMHNHQCMRKGTI